MPRNPDSDIYLRFRMPRTSNARAVNLAEAFGVVDTISLKMQHHTDECFAIYYDTHDCCCDYSSAQRIPYNIVDGLTSATFGEYEYTIGNAPQYYQNAFESIDRIKTMAFQYACIGGESLVKPVLIGNNFEFKVIPRNSYLVFERDSNKNITDIGMIECKKRIAGVDFVYYTLLERRYYDEQGRLTIEYRLYRSNEEISTAFNIRPGQLVPLNTLPEYAMLEEIATIPGKVDNLGLIPIRTNSVNCVDESNEPVSFYSAAVKEIKRLYQHEGRIQREYELTEPRLVIDADVAERDRRGRLIKLPSYIEALNTEQDDKSFQIFNPTPHQNELEGRENQLLRNIENILSLRRGRLSNVDSEDRTATEVQVTTAREALTINSLQNMFTEFMNRAVVIIGQLGKVYYKWEFTQYPEVIINWGNGILFDEEREYNRLYQLATQGLIVPEYLVAWLFNIKIDTGDPQRAAAQLAEIRQRYMPAVTNFEAMNTIIG